MVKECRYNMTHTTKGHKCGKCGGYGHGILECRNFSAKEQLKIYFCDIVEPERRCDVPGCDYNQYHTRLAHVCPICDKREPHTKEECPLNPSRNETYSVTCPICKAENMLINPRKIYGISDECCICMDNKVDILLDTCNHCCVCLECVKKMN